MGKLSKIKDKLIIYSYYLAVAIILFAVITDMAHGALNTGKAIAYYALDGNASDSTTYGKNGTIISTPTLLTGKPFCKVNKCYTGFSTTKYIDTPLTTTYIGTARNWDITFWGRSANVANGFSLGIVDTTTQSDAIKIGVSNYIGGDVRVIADAGGNSCNFYTTTSCFNDTNFHFVWIHRDATCANSFIYCNNAIKALTFTASADADYADNTDHFFIGCHNVDGTPTNNNNYTIDELGIWDGTLNTTDATFLYNSTIGLNPFKIKAPTSPPAPIPNMTISSTFPNNLNVTNSTLRFYFNGSVSNTRANNINCSFRLNSTLNQSKNLVTITYRLNFSISTVGWNKGYTANISCKNNNASASLLRTFWIYQPYVPPEEEPEDNTTGSYAELIAINNQIYEVLALIPFVLLWLGLWTLGYYALQTNNTLLAGTMIVLTLPLDFFFSYRFQETLMLGTGFLGIAFAVMTAWTIGIFVLLKRPVRG